LFVFLMGMLSSLITAPAFAQATTSVKCDDGAVVTVATGDKKGTCVGIADSFSCQSRKGSASGGCDSNGKPYCDPSSGGGSCSIQREAPKPTKGGAATRPGLLNEP